MNTLIGNITAKKSLLCSIYNGVARKASISNVMIEGVSVKAIRLLCEELPNVYVFSAH